jgi:hypothetical protein
MSRSLIVSTTAALLFAMAGSGQNTKKSTLDKGTRHLSMALGENRFVFLYGGIRGSAMGHCGLMALPET